MLSLSPALAELNELANLQRKVARLERENAYLRVERDNFRQRAHADEAVLALDCARHWWVRLVIRFGGAK